MEADFFYALFIQTVPSLALRLMSITYDFTVTFRHTDVKGMMNMQHTTRQIALHMIQAAPIFTLATIDANGFPTMVALSPMPTHRSLEELFFYTSRQTTTAQNIRASKRASLFCYNLSDYSSVMLKEHITFAGIDAFDQDWHLELNAFQRRLNYKDPVILRFQTSAVKVRQMMTMDHLELLDQPLD